MRTGSDKKSLRGCHRIETDTAFFDDGLRGIQAGGQVLKGGTCVDTWLSVDLDSNTDGSITGFEPTLIICTELNHVSVSEFLPFTFLVGRTESDVIDKRATRRPDVTQKDLTDA